jgi:hypothetical protein
MEKHGEEVTGMPWLRDRLGNVIWRSSDPDVTGRMGIPNLGLSENDLPPALNGLSSVSQVFIDKIKDIPHVWPNPYYPTHLCSCWLWIAGRSSSLDLSLNLEDQSGMAQDYWTSTLDIWRYPDIWVPQTKFPIDNKKNWMILGHPHDLRNLHIV